VEREWRGSYLRLHKTCHPGVFSFPLFSISPRSFCTRTVMYGTNPLCTVLVQREMEKVERIKLLGDTFCNLPSVRYPYFLTDRFPKTWSACFLFPDLPCKMRGFSKKARGVSLKEIVLQWKKGHVYRNPQKKDTKNEGNSVTVDYGKRVLFSHLFDFVFGDFWVLCLKRCTHMSPKLKSKR